MFHPWQTSFEDLRQQVNELFEELVYRRWGRRQVSSWQPPLDLHDSESEYIVEIDLPGVAPDQVEMLVSEGDLTIIGRREAVRREGVTASHCERQQGNFQRHITFRQAIDPQAARAECRQGTWCIRLPKKSPRQPPPHHEGAPFTRVEQVHLVRIVVQ